MAVDTKSVPGRRRLHFTSYEEMLNDVHALASRPTRVLGNWSLGQICMHLAAGINAGVDGAPFQPAWYFRLIGPLIKGWVISRPMSPGFKLPSNAGAFLPAPVSTTEGVAALEQAIARFRNTTDLKPHAVFGPMSREQWDLLQMRHGEMHLSFVLPAEEA